MIVTINTDAMKDKQGGKNSNRDTASILITGLALLLNIANVAFGFYTTDLISVCASSFCSGVLVVRIFQLIKL